jgi:hypothetical protein
MTDCPSVVPVVAALRSSGSPKERDSGSWASRPNKINRGLPGQPTTGFVFTRLPRAWFPPVVGKCELESCLTKPALVVGRSDCAADVIALAGVRDICCLLSYGPGMPLISSGSSRTL